MSINLGVANVANLLDYDAILKPSLSFTFNDNVLLDKAQKTLSFMGSFKVLGPAAYLVFI